MSHEAIYNTHSNVVTIDDTKGAFDVKGNSVTLNQSLVDAEVTRLQAVHDAKAYARSRAAEYPSIADQLDDIYHNGVDGWKATIKTTKDKYPKP